MNLTPWQTRALSTLVDAALARELAAQDVQAAPTLAARLHLNFCRRRERAAISRAFRLGLRSQRAYGVEEWMVWLCPDGTASLTSEEDVDVQGRHATLQEGLHH